MQPKHRKKLHLARETVRSLIELRPAALGKVVGGVSRATQCNSKDLPCTGTKSGGVTCESLDPDCPSGLATDCTCPTLLGTTC